MPALQHVPHGHAGHHVIRPPLCSGLRQLHSQHARDGAGDLLLEREDILHAAVEALAPHLHAVLHVHKLSRDAERVARAADTAFEHF